MVGECVTTVLTEGDPYAANGLGRIDLTFENPDGLAKIAFTNFQNFTLVGGSVQPAPTTTGATSVGGPLLTFAEAGDDFSGAPGTVSLTLEQADASVTTSVNFAVASSVCANPEQDPDEDGLLETDFDSPVGFASVVPEALRFEALYPNPVASGGATFRVGLPDAGPVQLVIYDVTGRRVATVTDRALDAGTHDLRWDGRGRSGAPVASGLYLARLTVGGTAQIHRLTVVR